MSDFQKKGEHEKCILSKASSAKKVFHIMCPGVGTLWVTESRAQVTGFSKFGAKSPRWPLLCHPGCGLRKILPLSRCGAKEGFHSDNLKPRKRVKLRSPWIKCCFAVLTPAEGRATLLSSLPTPAPGPRPEEVSISKNVAFFPWVEKLKA